MSDALRDHSQPCEHGRQISHWPENTLGSMCPGGAVVDVESVPWCAEHDAEMVSHTFGPSAPITMFCAVYAILETNVTKPCRLEEPARHYVIGEAE